jgi:uncharacterized protein (TIGR03067 family)
MRPRALTVLAVGLLLAGAAPEGDAAKEEAKKLEGTWAMVSGEQDGKPLPAETVQKARLEITGDRHTVKVGADTFVGTHKVDPAPKPKAIDSMDTEGRFKGQTIRGLYKLEGDQFTVCFAEPGKERPKEFTTKSGTGHILHVWKREKK